MAARKKPDPKPPKPPAALPRIHEAALEPGPSGVVLKGTEIDLAAAITRRRAGLNVVVCGDAVETNRALAGTIESAVGPCQRQDPHQKAGPFALPHFQQVGRLPAGHSFYETGNLRRKARKQP